MTKYDKKAKHYKSKADRSYQLAMRAQAKGALNKYRRHLGYYNKYSKAAKHFEELAEQQAHARKGEFYTTHPTKFRNASHQAASSRLSRAIARNVEATRRLQAGNRGAKGDGMQSFSYLIQ